MLKTILHIVLLFTLAVQAQAASFKVTIDSETPRVAVVEGRLMPNGGRLSLARYARDTGLYHGWATFLHEIEVTNASGAKLALEYIPGGHWAISGYDSGPVDVRYTMLLQHDRFPNDPGEDELAWARDWGVMWTGRALFLEGQHDGQIMVEFELPSDWRVSAPWYRAATMQHAFTVPDYDTLLDSAFVAGTQNEILVGDVRNPAAVIALGGESPLASADLITDLVGSAMDNFTKLFGASPSERLFLLAADGSFWGGGVMGNSISMIFGGPLDDTTVPMVAYITTHEMFHLWNANFNYTDQQAIDTLQWFSEGAAEYYTWLTFVRGGLADSEAFLGELGNRYGLYVAALGDLSLAQAGAVKLDHYDLIYSGGMMAAAALDIQIRAGTGGDKSLDDVLRLMQKRYSGNSNFGFGLDEFPDVMEDATGIVLERFFDRFIVGNAVLPMHEYFMLAGLSLNQTDEAGAYQLTIMDKASQQQAALWQRLTAVSDTSK